MGQLVCKFGGTSVASKERIEQLANIIELDSRRRIMVLSAPGKAPGINTKVTDYLINIVNNKKSGKAIKIDLEGVKKRYYDIYEPLGVATKKIDDAFGILEKRANSSNENADKYRDAVVASGEELNAILFAEYLKVKGVDAVYVSPGEAGLIVTDDFGDARPLPESRAKMAMLKEKCDNSIVIFPGFFGITEDGDIATFSRGGSDLTGALVADAIDAEEYENFTDVDGILSANPNQVLDPEQIPALTYKEMRELSYMGFNVFHEEAVRPVIEKKIPIRLRNTNNLDNEGTLIIAERLPTERDVVGIAGGGKFCSFNLQKFLMNREHGFGRKLLEVFEEMGLSYEHCPSGVDNISVIIDQDQLQPETANKLIRNIEEKLNPDEIKTEFGLALIAVVGEGLMHKVGVLAQATTALSAAGVNVKIANQGSSEISMIFGIDSDDADLAVKALYNVFFS